MTTALTSQNGSLWIQPHGPNHETYYLDCKDLGDIGIPEGAKTLIRCFDPAGEGWSVVGSTRTPPDPVTFDVTGLMFKAVSWLERVDCPFSMYVTIRDCGRADHFNNYVRAFVFTNVDRSNRTYSNLVMRETETEATLASSLEAYPPVYEIEQLGVSQQTGAGVDTLNDLAMNSDTRCIGDCGDTLDPCEAGLVVGDAQVATFADIGITADSGETWTITTADPYAVGVANALLSVVRFNVGRDTVRYLVGRLAAAGAGSVSYTDDGTGTWTAVALGAGFGPVYGGGLFALDENHIWCAGGNAAGSILFSDDGGETWTTQEDAVISAAAGYNCVHFEDSGQYGIAGTAAGVTAITTDGGQAWAAGGATGGGAILCCTMLDNNRAWVGDDGGALFYSTDGGATWTQRTGWIGSGVGDIRDMHWVNDHVAFMAYDTVAPIGHVHYTIDGGLSWDRLTTPTNAGLNAIYACDERNAFAVGIVVGGANIILHVAPPDPSN